MLKLTKSSIDVGIVVRDAEASLAFYRDTLGLTLVGDGPMPGAHMYRLMCGDTMVKLLLPKRELGPAAPGGILGSYGYRYFTISVSNVDEVVTACSAAGYTVAVPVTEMRPGTTIAIVEDPDGNWVEFLTTK